MRTPSVSVRALDVVLLRERRPVCSLREYAIRRTRGERMHTMARVQVLVNVSMEVVPGSTFGVIGANGAGKTTLLRVLAGIVPPSKGEVAVRGRVAPLIDLGAGFDPELTGVENVLLFGSLLGVPAHDLRRGMEAIAEFAGLRDVLDVAVKHYSTGMVARLGFSVATAARPSVLLVDEVLAVGDEEFRSRCASRIRGLKREGCAVVLVTHDLDLLRREADECVLLHDGAIAAAGSPADVAREYSRGVVA
jgi:ABC-type polysaccharide/polyol phosphate transport system ATPase subunit